MKRFWLIISSIIILNGAFFCNCNPAYGFQDTPGSIINRNPDTRKLRTEIRAILKDPRFTYHDTFGWLKSLINRISRSFRFKPFPKTPFFKLKGVKALVTGLKILGIGVLILLPLVIAFIGRLFLQRDRHVKLKQNQVSGATLNSASLKRSALNMAKTGQYREAIRYLYLAGLEKLKEENLLSQAVKFSDKQNLTHLRKILGEADSGYIAFRDLAGVFQEKWYGLKECGLADYQAAAEKLERVYAIKAAVISPDK